MQLLCRGCDGVDDKIAGKEQIKEWKDKFAYTVLHSSLLPSLKVW